MEIWPEQKGTARQVKLKKLLLKPCRYCWHAPVLTDMTSSMDDYIPNCFIVYTRMIASLELNATLATDLLVWHMLQGDGYIAGYFSV